MMVVVSHSCGYSCPVRKCISHVIVQATFLKYIDCYEILGVLGQYKLFSCFHDV